MGGRKNITPYSILNQSLATSFNTTPTIINYMDNVGYQINVTTTDSQGTFNVQGSNDYLIQNNTVINAGNWVSLTLGGGTPSVSAQNDTIAISLNQLPFSAIRLSYTSSVAGTGTCSIYLLCKEIGG